MEAGFVAKEKCIKDKQWVECSGATLETNIPVQKAQVNLLKTPECTAKAVEKSVLCTLSIILFLFLIAFVISETSINHDITLLPDFIQVNENNLAIKLVLDLDSFIVFSSSNWSTRNKYSNLLCSHVGLNSCLAFFF